MIIQAQLKNKFNTYRGRNALRGYPAENGKTSTAMNRKASPIEHLYLRYPSEIFSESCEVDGWRKKSDQILSIELGPAELRLLYLRRYGKKYQMESWFDHSTAKSDKIDFHHFPELISKFIKQAGIKKSRVVLSLYGPDVFIRTLTVPQSSGHALREAVFWAIKEELPVFSEHDLWDFQVVAGSADQNKPTFKILAAVAQASYIRKYLDLLKRINIYPEQIVLKPFALSSALQILTHPGAFSKKDFVIADLGKEKTLLCFYSKGILRYVRTITIGANQVDASLMQPIVIRNKNIWLRQEKVEKFKRQYGLSPILSKQTDLLKFPFNKLYAHLTPVLNSLVSEISRSFLFYQQKYTSEKINAVFLTGKAGGIKSFNHFLSEQTGIPVFYLAPKFPLIRIGNYMSDSEFTSLFGAACAKKNTLNLIPFDFRLNNRYRKLRKLLNYFLACLIICLSGSGFILTNEKNLSMQNLSSLNSKIEQLVSTERLDMNLSEETKMLKKQKIALTKALRIDKIMVDNLKIFSNHTPDDIVLTSITADPSVFNKAEEINSSTLLVEGKIYKNFVSADLTLIRFIKDLKDLNFYKTVEISKKWKDREHHSFSFELNLQVP